MLSCEGEFVYNRIVKKVNFSSDYLVEMGEEIGGKICDLILDVGGYLFKPVIEIIGIVDEFVFDSEFGDVEEFFRKVFFPQQSDAMFYFLS